MKERGFEQFCVRTASVTVDSWICSCVCRHVRKETSESNIFSTNSCMVIAYINIVTGCLYLCGLGVLTREVGSFY